MTSSAWVSSALRLQSEGGGKATEFVLDVVSGGQEIQTRLEHAAQDGDLAIVEELNTQFHVLIYEIADAPAIYRLVETAISRTPRPFYATVGGWPAATSRDHQAILKALRSSNNEAARRAMASDITRNGQLLARHLDSLA